jgi:hypothetical protein
MKIPPLNFGIHPLVGQNQILEICKVVGLATHIAFRKADNLKIFFHKQLGTHACTTPFTLTQNCH